MSVINQVLNQLEQRGVSASSEQPMIRVIAPRPKNRRWLWLVLFGVLLLALATGARVWLTRPLIEPPVLHDAQQVVATVPASLVAEPAVLPASRLSFELSSLPLPSSLRRAPGEPVAPVGVTLAMDPDRADPAPTPLKVENILHAESDPPLKRISPGQRADAEFRRAAALMQQGRVTDALAGYEAVLKIDAAHDGARQALVAMLLEQKRSPEAEQVLQEGQRLKPGYAGFAMTLARLQVERGALESAVATLELSLPHNPDNPDFQSFMAALLQRQGKHQEAAEHYQTALRLLPGNSLWLMGYGISLEALQRHEEAISAFKQALASGTLNPDLQKFVQQKLK